MKQRFRNALVVAACLAAPALAVASVDSPDNPEIRTARVSFDAAASRDQAATRQLFFRIRQAAEQVCRTNGNTRGVEIWTLHACEAEAVARAVRAANLPALESYYFGQSAPALAARR